MQLERQGAVSVPMTRRLPQVIGGICEYCGVIDNTKPSEIQYTLCPHYKMIGELRCSYCDENKDPNDVIYHGIINVHEHPEHQGTYIAVCNSFTCSEKHLARFQRNR